MSDYKSVDEVTGLTQIGTVIYVDEQALLAAANFLLDYLLLRATASITRTSARRGRIVLGAALGTLYYVAYVLSMHNLLPFYGHLAFPATVFIVSMLMLTVTFAPVAPGRLWSVLAHFYVIGFISAGSGLAGAQLLARAGLVNPLAGVAVAIGSLLVAAQAGWSVLQRRSWRQGQQLPVEITVGGASARLTALLDTGNRLCDPVSGAPAVVVEHKALANLLPPRQAQVLEQMAGGNLHALSDPELAGEEWLTRFRVLPFTSIGAPNGLMVGFRPDAITFWLDGKPHTLRACVVALAPHALDAARMYQALIGPDIIASAAHAPA